MGIENRQAIDPHATNADKPAKVSGVRPVLAQRLQEIASLLKESLDEEPFGPALAEQSEPIEAQPALDVPAEIPEAPPSAEIEPAAPEAPPLQVLEPASRATPLDAAVELPVLDTFPDAAPEPAILEPLPAPDAQTEIAGDIPGSHLESEAQLVPEETKAEPQAAHAVQWVTRGQAIGLAAGSSALALFLALVFGLGILAGLNRGRLQFASPAQVNDLAVQVEGVSARTQALEQDLQALQIRIAGLEILGGRVSAIEQASSELRSDIDQTGAEIAALKGEISQIQPRLETLENTSARVLGFMNGLRALLNDLFIPLESSK